MCSATLSSDNRSGSGTRSSAEEDFGVRGGTGGARAEQEAAIVGHLRGRDRRSSLGGFSALVLDIDEAVAEDGGAMDRFETASLPIMPGRRVRATVLSHHPWGVIVQIIGQEQVGASVDMIEQFGRTTAGAGELRSLFPAVGTEIDAVVQGVRRWSPPAWVRLSIRPADLESFSLPCDFCARPAVLSAGGEGLVLDVRSNDGPGSHTVIAHRSCLADRIEAGNSGERARARTIGRHTV